MDDIRDEASAGPAAGGAVRRAAAADKRADLDLQVGLLVEHEVTRLVTLVSGIADKLGVRAVAEAELDEIRQDVAPEAVLDGIEAAEPRAGQG